MPGYQLARHAYGGLLSDSRTDPNAREIVAGTVYGTEFLLRLEIVSRPKRILRTIVDH